MLVISDRITIPDEEFQFTYVRSSGPGGQNVNKTSSKAILRWSVMASPTLPEDVKQRFGQRFAGRITADGVLIVRSQRYRDQGRNVSDCFEKLKSMLLEVLVPPKVRRPTRSTRSSRERRLKSKQRKSASKQMRRFTGSDT